jgi:hypothetical protein
MYRLVRFVPPVGVLTLVTVLAGCSGSTGSTDDLQQGTVDRSQPSAPVDDGGTGTDADPGAASPPTVELTAAQTAVVPGDSVTLSWTSEHAGACEASGGWSGAQPLQGSSTVGPLDQSTTFTLTCTGSGGSAMAMLAVDVMGVVTISWQPPTENVDGTPLTDLAGYRIYYGEQSRDYTDQLEVSGATATARDVTLSSGAYYFAMTAVDQEGNESAFSNEVVRVID